MLKFRVSTLVFRFMSVVDIHGFHGALDVSQLPLLMFSGSCVG